MKDKRIPVTVLTGFLGAGKTTLLNALLTQQHGHKLAIIQNEFGQVGIDNQLVIGVPEELIETLNGCICCTVRRDLAQTLVDLDQRRRGLLSRLSKKRVQFERVVIETTGIADPVPVAQTFFIDEDVAKAYVLDSIITVVDARHGPAQVQREPAAQSQAGFADLIVINKTDLATPAEVDAFEHELRKLNPSVRILRTSQGQVDARTVLELSGFDLSAKLLVQPDFLDAAGHDHDHDHGDDLSVVHKGVASLAIVDDRPVEMERLEAWLGGLLERQANDLLRYKGVLHVAGEARRLVFQGMHQLYMGGFERPWGASEKRQTQMVFIGRNLDREALRAGFLSCLAEG